MNKAFESDDAVGTWHVSRRNLVQAGAGLASARAAGLAAAQQPCEASAQRQPADVGGTDNAAPNLMSITLQVNGRAHPITVDTRTTVLDALRETLALKVTK